jgi:hypothetical protein
MTKQILNTEGTQRLFLHVPVGTNGGWAQIWFPVGVDEALCIDRAHKYLVCMSEISRSPHPEACRCPQCAPITDEAAVSQTPTESEPSND